MLFSQEFGHVYKMGSSDGESELVSSDTFCDNLYLRLS